MLVLQEFGYDTRFLPDSGALEELDGAHLLLLAPPTKQITRRHMTVLALLRAKALDTGIPILELVSSSRKIEARGPIEPGGVVSWPCSTEELSKRIKETLPTNSAEQVRLVEQ